jgi:hypothetical protein
MARIKTHIEDTERILGEPFEYVHLWLDELTKKWPVHIHLEYHRKFRHHAQGVNEVIDKWGFYAGQAAKLHIIRDNDMFLPTSIIDIMREDQIENLYLLALQYCHKGDQK